MRLRSRQHIRRQADFAAVRNEGRRQHGAAFVFSVRRRPADPRFDLPRFAVVASRRVGNAVTRNLLRRRLRAIFRENQQLFPGDVDIVVTLQPRAAEATFSDLERYFRAAAHRAGFSAPPPLASPAASETTPSPEAP
jgi:ribonuclease P protein component